MIAKSPACVDGLIDLQQVGDVVKIPAMSSLLIARELVVGVDSGARDAAAFSLIAPALPCKARQTERRHQTVHARSDCLDHAAPGGRPVGAT